MKMPSEKLICVVDTNVFVHLFNNDLSRKNLLQYLFDHFEVHIPDAVIEELRPKSGGEIYSFCQRNNFKSCPSSMDSCRKEIIEKDEQKIKSIDRGEREVLSSALRLSREQKKIVFVITDDGKALDLFRSVVEHQSIGCLYSSLDFLVYLLIHHYNELKPSDFDQNYKHFKEEYAIDDRGRKLNILCPRSCQVKSCNLG